MSIEMLRKNQADSRFSIWMTWAKRFGVVGLAGMAVLISARGLAFFEEPELEPSQSTIHFPLVRALAICAGYEELADVVATYDELTDLGEDPNYDGTLCEGWVPEPPGNPVAAGQAGATLKDLVEGPINGCARFARRSYPSTNVEHNPACFTDRFRGTAPFFHFPQDDQLARIREWAFTPNAVLTGDIMAAYGGLTPFPLTWRCTAEWHDQVIDTGPIESNSPQAFGLYLHSLADHSSHFDCIRSTLSDDEPLDIPVHYGQWGESYCSFPAHWDELEVFFTELPEEAPLYRTLESIVGHEVMLWLYDNEIPHSEPYDFTGIYAELLAWREANTDLFAGNPDPVPMDLEDWDYQAIMEMSQEMILENAGPDGRFNGIYRVEDADDIAAFCLSIQ